MHQHCSRWPILSLTVWFIQYRMCECLGQSSRIFYSRYQLLVLGLQRTCTWWTGSRRRRRWRRWGATLSPGTSMSTQGINRHSKVWRQGVEWSKRKTYICLRENIFFQGKIYMLKGKTYLSHWDNVSGKICLSQGEPTLLHQVCILWAPQLCQCLWSGRMDFDKMKVIMMTTMMITMISRSFSKTLSRSISWTSSLAAPSLLMDQRFIMMTKLWPWHWFLPKVQWSVHWVWRRD